MNVVEARPPDVAHVANRQEGEEERAPNRWLNARTLLELGKLQTLNSFNRLTFPSG